MDPASIALIAVAVGLIGWKIYNARRSPEQLEQIATAVREGALLVDVRTKAEFSRGHLKKAINAPAVVQHPKVAKHPKGKPLVVYCASGARSSRAAAMLRQAGYENVMDLGPMTNGLKIGLA